MKVKTPYLWLLLGPLGLTLFGQLMNLICILANGQRMPVMVPYCTEKMVNIIHACGTPATHFKFLADFIVQNGGVSSLGDKFMEAGEALVIPFLVAWVVMTVIKYVKAK
jgi:hypothetical protein